MYTPSTSYVFGVLISVAILCLLVDSLGRLLPQGNDSDRSRIRGGRRSTVELAHTFVGAAVKGFFGVLPLGSPLGTKRKRTHPLICIFTFDFSGHTVSTSRFPRQTFTPRQWSLDHISLLGAEFVVDDVRRSS